MRYIGILVVFAAFVVGCGNKRETMSTQEEVVGIEETEDVDQVLTGKKVLLTTDSGEITLLLYDKTPLHQENFLKLVKEDFYEELLFHRIIKGFMVQGGDPKSRGADSFARLGSGGPGYTIPAEFYPELIHKRGALAAARTGGPSNPKKESSGSQYYIVQGKAYSDDQLNSMEQRVQQNRPGFTYTPAQREIYRTIGGTPFLDMDYTVYGEVIEGLDVVDRIALARTAPGDRPVKDIKMSMKLLKK